MNYEREKLNETMHLHRGVKMDKRLSISFSFVFNVIIIVMLAFGMTSVFSFASDSTSDELSTPTPYEEGSAKSLQELKEDVASAVDVADDLNISTGGVTSANAEEVRNTLSDIERALDAYVAAGGNEADFDLTKYNELNEAYETYIDSLSDSSTSVKVSDVKTFMNTNIPDEAFRNALLDNFKTYFADTNWDDASAVVKNNSDVVSEYPSEAPATFTNASDVLSWWGGDITLPSDCRTIDGVQYLGKDYYRTGDNELHPPKITTTNNKANYQEFFGSTYGNPDVTIYVDIDATSMKVITVLGYNWDGSAGEGIPAFAHSLQLAADMERTFKAQSLTFLRDKVDNISLDIKTGLTEYVTKTETEIFGPQSTNANFGSKGNSAYEVTLNSDGWSLKPTGNSVVYGDDDISTGGSDRDTGLNLYLRPGIWSNSNNTFYLYYCDVDFRGVQSTTKAITTTYGYCVPTKCISTLDADFETQLYGGFTFKKTSSITTTRGLAGAKYVVKNTDGKYLRLGGENSASEFVDTLSLATQFETDENGSFTVQKVPLGSVTEADDEGNLTREYTVTEIQAPAGYALDSTPIDVTVSGNVSGISTTFNGGEGTSVTVAGANNVTYTPDFDEGTLNTTSVNVTTDSSHDCYIANKQDKGDGVLGDDLQRIKYAVLDSDTENYSTVRNPTFSLVNTEGTTVLTASSLDDLKTQINEELIRKNAMKEAKDCYVIKASDPLIYYDENSTTTSVVEYSGTNQAHLDTPLPVNIKLKANKTLLGSALTAGQFTFSLTPKTTVTGDPVGPSGIFATNDENGEIDFGELSYTLPGTYTYTLKEVDESATNKRIDYDTKEHTITVVVTEDSDGLHATVNGDGDYTAVETNIVTYNAAVQNVIKSYADASTDVTFINYESIDLRGTKVWNDLNDFLGYRPDYTKGQTVQLTVKANGVEMNPQPTVIWNYSNNAGGTWSYVIERLRKVDDNNNPITYTVEETKVNNYDDPEKTYENVDENGDLITDFKNSLILGDLQIEKKNTATGSSAQNKYFEFLITLGKPSGGAYTGGTYVLPEGTITSLNSSGQPQNVLTQDTTYTYTEPFKVYLRGDTNVTIKNIVADSSYIVSETSETGFNEVTNKSGTISGKKVVFETVTNTPIIQALQFDKTVVGAADASTEDDFVDYSSSDDFTFVVKVGADLSSMQLYSGNYVVSGAGIEGTEHTIGTSSGSKTIIGELRSTRDGKVTLKKDQTITFAAEYGDDYFYTVTEEGKDEYTILPASASVDGSTSTADVEHFTNVRKIPEPTEVVIDVEKLLEAPSWTGATKEGYEFTLYGSEIPTKAIATLATSNGSFTYDTDSMQWSSTPNGTFLSYKVDYEEEDISDTAVTNSEGKAQFKRFKIAKEGEYNFKVKEVIPDVVTKDMVYDTNEITVTVKVKLDAKTNKLVSTVEYKRGETGNVEDGSLKRAFTNVQVAPDPDRVSFEITKNMTGKSYSAGDFSFTRRDVSTDLKNGIERQPDETVTNITDGDEDGNSSVKFGEITYEAPGTYIYEITENKGNDAGIEYSSEVITVKVEVEWVRTVDENRLEVTSVTYSNSSGNENDVITNKFTGPGGSDYNLEVNKKLFFEGTSLEAKFAEGQFEFALFDRDGEPIEDEDGEPITAKCTSDGKVTFPKFSVEYEEKMEEGVTIVYTIKEIKGDDDLIVTWDARTVTAKVRCWRDIETNSVKTDITYLGASGDASNDFVNEEFYVPPKEEAQATELANTGGTIITAMLFVQIAVAIGIAVVVFKKRRCQ